MLTNGVLIVAICLILEVYFYSIIKCSFGMSLYHIIVKIQKLTSRMFLMIRHVGISSFIAYQQFLHNSSILQEGLHFWHTSLKQHSILKCSEIRLSFYTASGSTVVRVNSYILFQMKEVLSANRQIILPFDELLLLCINLK